MQAVILDILEGMIMMSTIELRWLLKKNASRETSANPDLWTPENPLFAHCAVAAVTAQDFLGGKIVSRFFPPEWAEKFKNRSHYWNVLEGGSAVDFSRDQFPADFPWDDFVSGKIGEPRRDDDKREYILGNAGTAGRYNLLHRRIDDFLKQNTIFSDRKFQACWEFAFSEQARCKKMRFVCLAYRGSRLIARDVNRQMTSRFGKDRFCALDGSSCGREGLSHRADPSFGDCGHAPIWCLRGVFEMGYRPSELQNLDFYEQGFMPNGDPWFRPRAEYSCLSCENTFATFGLDKIWGVYEGEWTPLYTKDSFFAAMEYALCRLTT